MKAKSKSSGNVEVQLKLVGPAFRVRAHLVNSAILKKIKSATEEDALFEDNPISVVIELALDEVRVAEGFCIYQTEKIRHELIINGIAQDISEIGLWEKGCEFQECFTAPREEALVAISEEIEVLGSGLTLKKGEMFIIEIEETKYTELSVEISADKSVSVSDLRLGLVDLDVSTELSDATFGVGLLNGPEKDIRYLLYNNQRYEFDVDVMNGYASSFYLVKRNKDGRWVQEFLG